MATTSQGLAQTLTCHAWNGDCTRLAVCPNNSEVHIFRASPEPAGAPWERLQVLRQHVQVVSSLDWAPTSGQLVSCSHDSTAYVWSGDGGEWKPAPVILRQNKGALVARWSPSEKKFAVGCGSKAACICFYDSENDWWVNKMVKKHKSSVVDVAWHPSSNFIATASTDTKCRIFNAAIGGIDECPTSSSFGDLLMEFDCQGAWVNSVAWSPSGALLAAAGHNSVVSFLQVPEIAGTPAGTAPHCSSTTALPCLPLRSLVFLSDSVLVGAGFDRRLVVLKKSSQDVWELHKFLFGAARPSKVSSVLNNFSAALDMFKSKEKKGDVSAAASNASAQTLHQNDITQLCKLSARGLISSCGLDGLVAVWDVASEAGV